MYWIQHYRHTRRPQIYWAASLLISALITGSVYAQDTRPEFARLKFSPVLRQNEDWFGLAEHDPTQSGDLFDPIKYVSLSDDGSIWASFGGQARMRFESWNNFGFVSANDDNFLLTRLRLHADLHVGDQVRVFLEGKSALGTDRDLPGGNRGLDRDELDLQQAFVDLVFPLADQKSLTVRGGRQMLSFGKQRLVSPLDWSNTMRAWDGVSAVIKCPQWTVTGFWTHFVPVMKYEFNDPDAQEQFYGIYATGHVPTTPIGLDIYWLMRERDVLHEDRYTFGGRLFGKIGESNFDYDVEGAYQGGERGGLGISAFMVATQLGLTFADCPAKPRVWVGFDYASGDGSPTDGDLETFDQTYPLGHAYLGYIDVVGRQNVSAFSTGLSAEPIGKLKVNLAGHVFWRADDDDALFNAGGAVVRPGAASSANHIGSEIDLTLAYPFNRHLVGLFGYSHFFAGDFVDETGSSDDIDFVYVSLQFTF